MKRTMLDDNFRPLLARYPTALGNVYCGAFIGNGWFTLIIPVLEACERNEVEIHQIKEKFGGLRVYTDRVNADVDAAIGAATANASKTCESCGGVSSIYLDGGWYSTLCQVCK